MRKIIALVLVFLPFFLQAQQLNCVVTVNAQKLPNATQSVFKTLQTSLNDFVNKTDWTGLTLKQNERISCAMLLTIDSNIGDDFTGTLQIQSSRPVFNSSFSTPVVNINDKNLTFKYTEFENLQYDPNTYNSNLISIISFYAQYIIGMDADTFVSESGNTFLETAQTIANVAQQGGNKGWSQNDGRQTRYFLISDLLSQNFSEVRQSSFSYHTALDGMTGDLKKAKEKIKTALFTFSKINASKPNAYLTQTFFDAKTDEIVSIFSGGPSINVADLVDNLNRISPLNSSKWAEIKL
jgi:Domain of unknown function (DUF4835)